MGKLFVLADHEKRFNAQLGISSSQSLTCNACGMAYSQHTAADTVFWETEFCDIGRALATGRHVFFAEGQAMYVDSDAKQVLVTSKLPLKLKRARVVRPEWLEGEPDIRLPRTLWRVLPVHMIKLATEIHGFSECRTCDRFSDAAWHITRLNVPAQLTKGFGMFGILQNRGGAIFIDEALKDTITALNLNGIGFYSAGISI